jgi:hypothetical protein
VLITHLHVVWVRLDVLPNQERKATERDPRVKGLSSCCLYCNAKARRNRPGWLSTSLATSAYVPRLGQHLLEAAGSSSRTPAYFPRTRSTSFAIARTLSK